MSIIIVFGHPGAGKTFVGRVLQKYFNYYFYDGDTDLPQEMKEAIKAKAPISEEIRNIFFYSLIRSVRHLKTRNKKIVVAQTFILEKYRMLLLSEIPEAQFVLVHTDTTVREKRLLQRIEYPLDLEYARKMSLFFESPRIDHHTITNSMDGVEGLKKQITRMLRNRKYF